VITPMRTGGRRSCSLRSSTSPGLTGGSAHVRRPRVPSPNVTSRAYLGVVSEYTLLPDVPCILRRYTVTVTVPRNGDWDDALLPPERHTALQLAVTAVEADGLVSAWTCEQAIVSMVVDAARKCDALHAGVAVASVLDCGDGAVTVTAEPT
jgi:hypothetical protein